MTDPTLSIVIPCLDEIDTIAECLDLLIAQANEHVEILIVDNGSSDGTVELVQRYVEQSGNGQPDIRLIHESTRGVASARSRGFDEAKAPLLARIDADTRVPPNWIEQYQRFFAADVQQDWACAIGRGTPYGVPLSRFKPNARVSWGTVKPCRVTFGANMMIRKDAWNAVRDQVLTKPRIYEDVDLGLCLRKAGLQTALLTGMTVGVSPRRWFDNPIDSWRYLSGCPRTFREHDQPVLAAAIYACLVPVNAIHTARWMVLSAYDEQEQRFSLQQLRKKRVARVLP